MIHKRAFSLTLFLSLSREALHAPFRIHTKLVLWTNTYREIRFIHANFDMPRNIRPEIPFPFIRKMLLNDIPSENCYACRYHALKREIAVESEAMKECPGSHARTCKDSCNGDKCVIGCWIIRHRMIHRNFVCRQKSRHENGVSVLVYI